MNPLDFKIGPFTLGNQLPPVLVAELGVCHLGSIERALQTVYKIFEQIGPTIVKTETFQPDRMVDDPNLDISSNVLQANGEITQLKETLLHHMQRLTLSLNEHAQIAHWVKSHGGAFMSTAHDFEAIDFLVRIGADAIKIASPDIVHYSLIRYAAKTGLPIVLDTGGAAHFEIARAVWEIKEQGNHKIEVNHHPGGHPAPAQNYGFQEMVQAKNFYQTLVGTADHYAGEDMILIASALGANLIEKPITLNRLPEPEQIYATEVNELKNVHHRMMNAWLAVQSIPDKKGSRENPGRMSYRIGKKLPEGHVISLNDLHPCRPRRGIGVEYVDQIVGKTLAQSVQEGELLSWEMLK